MEIKCETDPRVDIVALGNARLMSAIEIACGERSRAAKAYQCTAIDDVPTLIFMWSTDDKPQCIKLPFPMNATRMSDFAQGWLDSLDKHILHEPEHDGGNKLGWRVFNDCWGHVGGCHYAIVGIQPAWIMYPK